MVILSFLTKWVDNRDSKQRVHPRDIWALGGRWFILNPTLCVSLDIISVGKDI